MFSDTDYLCGLSPTTSNRYSGLALLLFNASSQATLLQERRRSIEERSWSPLGIAEVLAASPIAIWPCVFSLQCEIGLYPLRLLRVPEQPTDTCTELTPPSHRASQVLPALLCSLTHHPPHRDPSERPLCFFYKHSWSKGSQEQSQLSLSYALKAWNVETQ